MGKEVKPTHPPKIMLFSQASYNIGKKCKKLAYLESVIDVAYISISIIGDATPGLGHVLYSCVFELCRGHHCCFLVAFEVRKVLCADEQKLHLLSWLEKKQRKEETSCDRNI